MMPSAGVDYTDCRRRRLRQLMDLVEETLLSARGADLDRRQRRRAGIQRGGRRRRTAAEQRQ